MKEELLKELKDIPKYDNEAVHVVYDKLMCAIAEEYAPEIKKEADEVVKDVTFWYA